MAVLEEGLVEGRKKVVEEREQKQNVGSLVLTVAKPSPVRVKKTRGATGRDVSMVGGDASTRLKHFFVFSKVQLYDF